MAMSKDDKTINLDGELVNNDLKYAQMDNPFDHWRQLPHYHPHYPTYEAEVEFIFDCEEDVAEFATKTKANITERTKALWYPEPTKFEYTTTRWASDRSEKHQPKYPIYIPSKTRWDIRLTSDTLIRMGCKHYMIVEEHQLENYKAKVDPEWVTLLVLPQKYLDEYDTCDDLGTTKSKGPGAARNFAWEHSIANGHKRHWVMDDNMKHFYRLDGDKRIIVADGAIIRAMEDHADQFTNCVMTGPHYNFFAVPKDNLSPFVPNTRVYSCNLIQNDIPFRWRGRYNEDTILSLDILKAGYCTMQYHAFLCGKIVTQALAGGNTAEFYALEGTKPKSQMLVDVHPDVSEMVWKHGRWHHFVNYLPYKKTRLIYADPNLPDEPNEYGMQLIKIEAEEE
jgi:hypothetical protein